MLPMAIINIIEKENLVQRAAQTGVRLKAELEKLYQYPIVGDVRGIGLLWAVELMADRRTRTRLDSRLGVGNFIRQWCWEHGMILRNNGNILVTAPALVISDEEIDVMIAMLEQAIAAATSKFMSP